MSRNVFSAFPYGALIEDSGSAEDIAQALLFEIMEIPDILGDPRLFPVLSRSVRAYGVHQLLRIAFVAPVLSAVMGWEYSGALLYGEQGTGKSVSTMMLGAVVGAAGVVNAPSKHQYMGSQVVSEEYGGKSIHTERIYYTSTTHAPLLIANEYGKATADSFRLESADWPGFGTFPSAILATTNTTAISSAEKDLETEVLDRFPIHAPFVSGDAFNRYRKPLEYARGGIQLPLPHLRSFLHAAHFCRSRSYAWANGLSPDLFLFSPEVGLDFTTIYVSHAIPDWLAPRGARDRDRDYDWNEILYRELNDRIALVRDVLRKMVFSPRDDDVSVIEGGLRRITAIVTSANPAEGIQLKSYNVSIPENTIKALLNRHAIFSNDRSVKQFLALFRSLATLITGMRPSQTIGDFLTAFGEHYGEPAFFNDPYLQALFLSALIFSHKALNPPVVITRHKDIQSFPSYPHPIAVALAVVFMSAIIDEMKATKAHAHASAYGSGSGKK